MPLKYLSLLLLLPFVACSQASRTSTRTSWYRLGDDSVSVTVTDFGGRKSPVYLHLHDDESTSLQAALPLIRRGGGRLVKINNGGNRNIVFHLDSAEYIFDPNRVFSRNGIVLSLVRHKRISNRAVSEIERFARFFLDQLPDDPSIVVALHNNVNGSLSVNSYTGDGEEAGDAAAVSRIRLADPDDFILTTEAKFYEALRKDFNIILQNTTHAKQDGSLSIYFGEKNIPYVNCETEHNHLRQFERMLRAVQQLIPGK